MKLKYKSCLFFLVMCFTACTKFVQVDPPVTEITGSTVFANNTSAAAVMTGIYSNMMGSGGNLSSGPSSISFICGMSADELTNYFSSSAINTQYYSNTLNSQSVLFWVEIFNEIHAANAVIEGLRQSAGVSAAMKNQLTGEAKFMRAFFYFYAVNMFGDVPLVTTTDYITNNSIARSPADSVYQQIISDLKDAQSLLGDSYLDANGIMTTDRARPNKGAAEALLARVYLYKGDWADAKTASDSVIMNTANYNLQTDLTQVFLANSQEAVWQLAPSNPAYNTYDAFYFILNSAPGNAHYPVALSTNLLNVFEPNDSRFVNWIDSLVVGTTAYYYPYKYKVGARNQPVTEYVMVLRLAEQFLVRAEAEANGAGGGLPAAVADLNLIRERAGLPDYSGTVDQSSLASAILHERQVELFTEWGHRWFDLKRTGTVNSVMSVVTPEKGGSWDPNWALFPLRLSDIQIDPNLKQNPGYN